MSNEEKLAKALKEASRRAIAVYSQGLIDSDDDSPVNPDVIAQYYRAVLEEYLNAAQTEEKNKNLIREIVEKDERTMTPTDRTAGMLYLVIYEKFYRHYPSVVTQHEVEHYQKDLMAVASEKTGSGAEKKEKRKYTKSDHFIVIHLSDGDEILEEISKICELEHVSRGVLNGVGMASAGAYAIHCESDDSSGIIRFQNDYSAFLSGMIFTENRNRKIHAHILLTDESGTKGGHLISCITDKRFDVMITEIS